MGYQAHHAAIRAERARQQPCNSRCFQAEFARNEVGAFALWALHAARPALHAALQRTPSQGLRHRCVPRCGGRRRPLTTPTAPEICETTSRHKLVMICSSDYAQMFSPRCLQEAYRMFERLRSSVKPPVARICQSCSVIRHTNKPNKQKQN